MNAPLPEPGKPQFIQEAVKEPAGFFRLPTGVDVRRLVHEGRCWLEGESLMCLIDDPYTREEVLSVVDRSHPEGLRGFQSELRERRTDRLRLRNDRERQKDYQRRMKSQAL